jgi:rubrerythrin
MIKDEIKAYHICQVCGYVTDRNLPDECPVCGATKDRFMTLAA